MIVNIISSFNPGLQYDQQSCHNRRASLIANTRLSPPCMATRLEACSLNSIIPTITKAANLATVMYAQHTRIADCRLQPFASAFLWNI